jgi:hypothetical protein
MQFGPIKIENLVLHPAANLSHCNKINRAEDLGADQSGQPQNRNRGAAGEDR